MKKNKTARKTADALIILLTAAVLFFFVFMSMGIAGRTSEGEIDHYASADEGVVSMTGYQTLGGLKNSKVRNPFPAGVKETDKGLWNVMNAIILTGGMTGLGILYLSDAAGRKICCQNPGLKPSKARCSHVPTNCM